MQGALEDLAHGWRSGFGSHLATGVAGGCRDLFGPIAAPPPSAVDLPPDAYAETFAASLILELLSVAAVETPWAGEAARWIASNYRRDGRGYFFLHEKYRALSASLPRGASEILMLPADIDAMACGLVALGSRGALRLLPCEADDVCALIFTNVKRTPAERDAGSRLVLNTWLPPRAGSVESDKWADGGVKVDEAALCNALRAAYLVASERIWTSSTVWRDSFDLIAVHFTSGRYKDGTRYYVSPAMFLWFFTRLVAAMEKAGETPAIAAALRLEVGEHLARIAPERMHAFPAALTILAATQLGVPVPTGVRGTLAGIASRREERAFPLYKFGSRALYFVNEHLTTAAALAALTVLDRRPRSARRPPVRPLRSAREA